MALDLTRQHIDTSNTKFIEHAVHHDIELVFWVMVSICLIQAADSRSRLMTATLEGLTCCIVGIVASTKSGALYGRKILTKIVGPFYELRDFLKVFADYYHQCSKDDQPIDALKAFGITVEHRDELAPDAGENLGLMMAQQPSPITPPRPTATVDLPQRKSDFIGNYSKTGEGNEQSEEEESGPQGRRRSSREEFNAIIILRVRFHIDFAT
ncbi:hypothetical protein FRC01_001512 [Tulasnella sp. 417]|nr:hypothetical protein FRC01_001512 [Tulasnella sp. 417]